MAKNTIHIRWHVFGSSLVEGPSPATLVFARRSRVLPVEPEAPVYLIRVSRGRKCELADDLFILFHLRREETLQEVNNNQSCLRMSSSI